MRKSHSTVSFSLQRLSNNGKQSQTTATRVQTRWNHVYSLAKAFHSSSRQTCSKTELQMTFHMIVHTNCRTQEIYTHLSPQKKFLYPIWSSTFSFLAKFTLITNFPKSQSGQKFFPLISVMVQRFLSRKKCLICVGISCFFVLIFTVIVLIFLVYVFFTL